MYCHLVTSSFIGVGENHVKATTPKCCSFHGSCNTPSKSLYINRVSSQVCAVLCKLSLIKEQREMHSFGLSISKTVAKNKKIILVRLLFIILYLQLKSKLLLLGGVYIGCCIAPMFNLMKSEGSKWHQMWYIFHIVHCVFFI